MQETGTQSRPEPRESRLQGRTISSCRKRRHSIDIGHGQCSRDVMHPDQSNSGEHDHDQETNSRQTQQDSGQPRSTSLTRTSTKQSINLARVQTSSFGTPQQHIGRPDLTTSSESSGRSRSSSLVQIPTTQPISLARTHASRFGTLPQHRVARPDLTIPQHERSTPIFLNQQRRLARAYHPLPARRENTYDLYSDSAAY